MTLSGLRSGALALLLTLLANLPACAAGAAVFKAGQMWSIKDSAIRIVIGTIEPSAGGRTAIGISVFGVPCPPHMGCTTAAAAYVPYDRAALVASVGRLLSGNARPDADFAGGHSHWKTLHGGLLTIPVRQLPAVLFRLQRNDPFGLPREIWE